MNEIYSMFRRTGGIEAGWILQFAQHNIYDRSAKLILSP